MRLDGDALRLLSIALGQPGAPAASLDPSEFTVDPRGLTLHSPPAGPFTLETEVEISPEANTTLSGLYLSGGRLCTQCEAEGFRRITFHPDRPDLLSRFRVRIEADQADCPVLLCNGNCLETGELETLDAVRYASDLAIRACFAAGPIADGEVFIKTSTGKVTPAATMPVVLVMLEAIRDAYRETGIRIGMKPAGGIRTAKSAIAQLVMVHETLGPEWLHPHLFRFGASTLLNDLLRQIVRMRGGGYAARDDFAEA
jgi:hypothetical protein